MNFDQIKELMTRLEESKLSKIVVKQGDFELHLEKDLTQGRTRLIAAADPESSFPSEIPLQGERGGSYASQPGTFVVSPMVGTYYASSAPDQAPFVKVGDQVSENTIVCIVEAMKVMNEVKAQISGTIAEIMVDNAQPVEFGTKLFRIV